MDKYSYAGSVATSNELIANAERLRPILEAEGLTLVGVNKYYKTHCAARKSASSTIWTYSVYKRAAGHEVRLEGQMGYGYTDPWQGSPNLVKVEDIGIGQMELDI